MVLLPINLSTQSAVLVKFIKPCTQLSQGILATVQIAFLQFAILRLALPTMCSQIVLLCKAQFGHTTRRFNSRSLTGSNPSRATLQKPSIVKLRWTFNHCTQQWLITQKRPSTSWGSPTNGSAQSTYQQRTCRLLQVRTFLTSWKRSQGASSLWVHSSQAKRPKLCTLQTTTLMTTSLPLGDTSGSDWSRID